MRAEDTIQIECMKIFNTNIEFKENNRFFIPLAGKTFDCKVLNPNIWGTHIANEFSTDLSRAQWAKKEALGLNKGEPDLVFHYVDNGQALFFYIEMKTPESYKKSHNGLSQNEQQFHNIMHIYNVPTFICATREQFLRALESMRIIEIKEIAS